MPLDQELSRELSEETREVSNQPVVTESDVISEITETPLVADPEMEESKAPSPGDELTFEEEEPSSVKGSSHPGQMRLLEEEVTALTKQQMEMQMQITNMNNNIAKQTGLLTRCLNENEKFQIQVRQNMYQELEQLKKQVDGGHLIPILNAIADLYSEYHSILFLEDLPERTQNNLEAMFDQLQELLEENGAEIFQSKVGDQRANRRCRVISTIPTSNPELHNTIAAVKRCGVMLGTQVLTREWVDVYVYKELEQENLSPVPQEKPEKPIESEQSADAGEIGAEEAKS